MVAGGRPLPLGRMEKDVVSWLSNLQNAYAIHNVIAHRPELPVYVIRDGAEGLEWMDLSDPSNAMATMASGPV